MSKCKCVSLINGHLLSCQWESDEAEASKSRLSIEERAIFESFSALYEFWPEHSGKKNLRPLFDLLDSLKFNINSLGQWSKSTNIGTLKISCWHHETHKAVICKWLEGENLLKGPFTVYYDIYRVELNNSQSLEELASFLKSSPERETIYHRDELYAMDFS